VLVVVLAVSNRMIAAQRNETAQALREKERALSQAEAQGRRADANFWKAVFSVREVMTEPAIGWTEASPALRRQLGAASLRFYQNLLRESGGDPNVRCEAAVGYRMMGTVRTRWEEYPKAEQMFRQASKFSTNSWQRTRRTGLTDTNMRTRARGWRNAGQRGTADDAAAVRARAIELCAALVAEPPDAYDHLVALATLYREELEARGRAATTQQVQACIERLSALYQRRWPRPERSSTRSTERTHAWRWAMNGGDSPSCCWTSIALKRPSQSIAEPSKRSSSFKAWTRRTPHTSSPTRCAVWAESRSAAGNWARRSSRCEGPWQSTASARRSSGRSNGRS
jgi:hypothetical protein